MCEGPGCDHRLAHLDFCCGLLTVNDEPTWAALIHLLMAKGQSPHQQRLRLCPRVPPDQCAMTLIVERFMLSHKVVESSAVLKFELRPLFVRILSGATLLVFLKSTRILPSIRFGGHVCEEVQQQHQKGCTSTICAFLHPWGCAPSSIHYAKLA